MTRDIPEPLNIPGGDTPRTGSRRPQPPHPSRGGDDLLAISWRLEPRDYVIAHLLAEHRYLTTEQIAAILFNSPRTCRNRLDLLRRLGFIDWFMPVHPLRGRLPVHWVPGRLSTRYVALYHDRPIPSTRAARDQRDMSPATATRIGHLQHDDGVHQFFIDLLAHARTHPEARLARWWSPARTFAKINHGTRPDGHGVWREHDAQVAFFLEYDTGTESHPTRAAKLAGYRTLHQQQLHWPVLFWLPTTAIETNVHQHLAGQSTGVLVATAARNHATDHGGPAGPVWQIIGDDRTSRLRLAQLPGPVGTPGLAYHPGPPEPDEDPLYLLADDTAPGAT